MGIGNTDYTERCKVQVKNYFSFQTGDVLIHISQDLNTIVKTMGNCYCEKMLNDMYNSSTYLLINCCADTFKDLIFSNSIVHHY